MITPSDSRQKQRSTASLGKRETVMKKKSTYRLLVQSEEKSRNILEIALYGLVALSVLAAIWQFADEPAMPTYQIGTAIARPIEMGS
jgi:hypothetical protein